MKKNILLLIGIAIAFLSAEAQQTEEKSSKQEITSKVDVYYFHGDRRCKTCKAVGSVTHEYLKEAYAKEVEAGIVNFHDVNYDQDENKELAKKMEVSGSSLLVKKTQGTLVRVENITNLAFMYAIANPDQLKITIKKKIDDII